jgi:multiple sugar transport system substrate-binding protein
MPLHIPDPGRRSFLRGLLAGGGALLAGGALSACSQPIAAGSGRTLVRFWNLFEGGEFPILEEMYAGYRKENPDVDFRPVTLSWGQPYYTKLAMSSAGGRAPETAIAHMSRVTALGEGKMLAPFDLDLLAELGLHRKDFNPDLWDRASLTGGVYAIPLDTHPILAFYNLDYCRQVGLLDGDNRLVGLDSRERYLEAGRELAKVSKGFGYSQGGVWRTFWTFFGQAGGTMTIPRDNDSSALKIDADIAVSTLEFMKQIHDGTISPTVDGSDQYATFVSKRSGVLFGGTWSLATLRDTDIKLDAAPFPQVLEQPGAFADSHSFVLPFQRDVNENDRRAAHEFVAYMLKAGTIWATAGHVPAYRPVRETAEYRAMVPQSHYQAAADHLILAPDAWFAGSGSPYEDRGTQIFQASLLNQLSPEQAVDQFLRETRKQIEAPSPL